MSFYSYTYSLLTAVILSLTFQRSAAIGLTYALAAHEKACFYIYGDQVGRTIQFYFSVYSGGSFDIDYTVTGPNKNIILQGSKERQGEYVFKVNSVGEHAFCFNNEMSTFAEKVVDFEINIENEVLPSLPVPPRNMPTLVSSSPAPTATNADFTQEFENSLNKLSMQLSLISRNQKYFRTRENRNFSTVRSTEHRIFTFSIAESFLIILMAILQVFIVRHFFQGARKRYV